MVRISSVRRRHRLIEATGMQFGIFSTKFLFVIRHLLRRFSCVCLNLTVDLCFISFHHPPWGFAHSFWGSWSPSVLKLLHLKYLKWTYLRSCIHFIICFTFNESCQYCFFFFCFLDSISFSFIELAASLNYAFDSGIKFTLHPTFLEWQWNNDVNEQRKRLAISFQIEYDEARKCYWIRSEFIESVGWNLLNFQQSQSEERMEPIQSLISRVPKSIQISSNRFS